MAAAVAEDSAVAEVAFGVGVCIGVGTKSSAFIVTVCSGSEALSLLVGAFSLRIWAMLGLILMVAPCSDKRPSVLSCPKAASRCGEAK